jgi:hypothetical protein
MDAERKRFLDTQKKDNLKQNPNLKPLYDKLLSIGGTHAVLPIIEEDLAKILRRGVILPGKSRTMRGRPISCHSNMARLWDLNKGRIIIYTGYALSGDGVWRQHSYGWDKVNKQVIESTVKRILYFGFPLSEKESEKFYQECL